MNPSAPTTWIDALSTAPLAAMVVALGIVVLYLFRSREKLQVKYTEDLVKASQSLQALTVEYLKQAFSDSAAWQNKFVAVDGRLGQIDLKLEQQTESIEDLTERLDRRMAEHCDRLEKTIKDHFDRVPGRTR